MFIASRLSQIVNEIGSGESVVQTFERTFANHGNTLPTVVAGTKKIYGVGRCRVQASMMIGKDAKLSLQVKCKSSFITADLHNGKVELGALLRCRSDAIRLAMAGNSIAATIKVPPDATTALTGTTYTTAPIAQCGGYNTAGWWYIHYDTTNLKLVKRLSDGSSTNIVSVGDTYEAQTVVATDMSGVWSRVYTNANDAIYMVFGADTKQMFYNSVANEKFYLTSRMTTYPAAASYGLAFPYAISSTEQYFFYVTSFAASGKTYLTLAVLKRDGVTWTNVRFGGAAWLTGGYNYTNMEVYVPFPSTPRYVYVMLSTYGTAAATMGNMLVWVDLSNLTASTAPMSVDFSGAASGEFQYSPFSAVHNGGAHGHGAKVWPLMSSNDAGDARNIYGNATAGASVTSLTVWHTSSSLANWKTAPVYSQRVTSGMLKDNFSLEAAAAPIYLTSTEPSHYDIAYTRGYHTGAYRVIANYIPSRTLPSATILNTPVFSTGVTSNTHVQSVTANFGGSPYKHLVVLSGDINVAVVISWGSNPLSVSLDGTLTATVEAVFDLDQIFAGGTVEMDGVLLATALATMDLSAAPVVNVYLDGLLSSASSAVASLRSPVYLDASTFCAAEAWLDLRAGKTTLDGVFAASCAAVGVLSIDHVALLAGTVQASATAGCGLMRGVALSGSGQALGNTSAALSVVLTLSGSCASAATSTCTETTTIHLSGFAQCVCAAHALVFGAAPTEHGIAVLVDNGVLCVGTDDERITVMP